LAARVASTLASHHPPLASANWLQFNNSQSKRERSNGPCNFVLKPGHPANWVAATGWSQPAAWGGMLE
jgi:hypothetical protein